MKNLNEIIELNNKVKELTAQLQTEKDLLVEKYKKELESGKVVLTAELGSITIANVDTSKTDYNVLLETELGLSKGEIVDMKEKYTTHTPTHRITFGK
mgnify:CR=1 FL=1